MTIFREKRRKHFTMINNSVLQDTRLSLRARGLLGYMLSMPDNWGFSIKSLVANNKDKDDPKNPKNRQDGETAVRTSLNELKKAGYLKLIPKKRVAGQFQGNDWLLTEEPFENNQQESSENVLTQKKSLQDSSTTNRVSEPFSPCVDLPHAVEPNAAKPDAVEPHVAEPNVVNRPLQNTNNTKDYECNTLVNKESVTPSSDNNYASMLKNATSEEEGPYTENPVPENEYGGEDNGLASKVQEILDYFKQEVGYGYPLNSYTLQTIGYELDKGYSVEQCKAVIRKKVIEWGENPRMKQWLRIETIFNRKKFDGYVSQPMQVALNAQQAAIAESHGGKRVEAGTDWSQHHQAQHGSSQSNADRPALTMAQIEQILGNSGGDA